MTTTQVGHVLDNPVWHALNSHHAHFAKGTDLAKRYPREVTIAAAIVDHSNAAIRDLEQIVRHGETSILFEANPPENIAGWTIQRSLRVVQMVCEARVPQPESSLEIVELDVSDMSEMMPLIDLTHPGPFFSRSVEIGRYIGIRDEGQLVAMGGERFRLTGYCELSAICTHPDWQGQGYARLLTSILTNGIWERGETPYLHVYADNAAAYHLYESMGFRTRCNMVAHVMSRA